MPSFNTSRERTSIAYTYPSEYRYSTNVVEVWLTGFDNLTVRIVQGDRKIEGKLKKKGGNSEQCSSLVRYTMRLWARKALHDLHGQPAEVAEEDSDCDCQMNKESYYDIDNEKL